MVLALGGLALLAVALVMGVALGTVSIAPAEPGDPREPCLRYRRWADVGPGGRDDRVGPAPAARPDRDGRRGRACRCRGDVPVLLRNPLADPYVLGTASGAALGAAIAVLIPVRLVVLEFGLLHGLAFLGALLAVYAVYGLSR